MPTGERWKMRYESRAVTGKKADVRQQVKSGMNSWLLPIPKLNGSDSFLEIPKTHILAK